VERLKELLGKLKSKRNFQNKRSLFLIFFLVSTLAITVGLVIGKESIDLRTKAKEEALVSSYIDQLTGNVYQSRQAAEELLEKPDIYVPYLLNILQKEKSDELKGQIIFLLGKSGSSDAVLQLVKALEDNNSYIRKNSAQALGQIKGASQNRSSLDALAKSLADESEGVRMNAALSLGKLGNSASTKSLLDRLSKEKSIGVKIAIVSSLGKLKDKTASQRLISELNLADISKDYQDEIIITLGKIKDSLALPILNAKLKLTQQMIKQAKAQKEDALIIGQLEITQSLLETAIGNINK
jgi:HEAT repeat protein